MDMLLVKMQNYCKALLPLILIKNAKNSAGLLTNASSYQQKRRFSPLLLALTDNPAKFV
jgi:hypothetical protein